jgi:HAE1 family hydrophobic/amphiphilic exporter-1
MFLSKLSINRPVTVTMLIFVFVIFGALAYFDLSLNMMPDIKLPFVTIQTIYPGAGPAEVELQVTKQIEDAVSTISGINYIESYSMDNVSFVLMNFQLGKDVDIANAEVKDKVDAILNNLPANALRPIVGKFDFGSQPVVSMVLSGTQPALDLFEYADKVLKDRLSQIEGVAQVDVSGGQEREIQIVLDERTVFSNNISLPQLSQLLSMHNVDLPSGSFRVGNLELSVKTKGEINDIQTLRDIEVPTTFGMVKLSQIAEVVDVGSEVRERTTFIDARNKIKHENVISINLIKSADGNAVNISKALMKQFDSINSALPHGMELTIINDGSVFIESSVSDTLTNIYLGIMLTALILLFFLHDIRSTLIVAITMPLSIISTFIGLQIAGFSLNMMSLLGLSTSVGVLVTNSIIVIENIFRHKEMGLGKKEAADKGTSEIVVAVIAATLTNIVVFLPIGAMGGMVGQFFTEFALTVVIATMFSLLIAFTITPMLASIILPERVKPNKLSSKLNSFIKSVEAGYHGMLTAMMRKKSRSSMVLICVVVLFIFSLWVFTKIGFEFTPNLDEGDISITVELPIGYNLTETAATLNEIEEILTRYNEIRFLMTNLGVLGRMDRGLNLATITIKLVDPSVRNYSTEQVGDRMIRDLSRIPNAKIKVSASSGGMGGGDPISLYLIGNDDAKLLEISDRLLDQMKDIPGIINLDTSTRSGRPEITIEPKRDQLALTGNNVMELALAVRAAIEGMVSTQFKDGGNEYDIKVTMVEESYNSPEKLNNLTIVTSRGKFQLAQLADVYFSEGVNKIIHRDKAKAINITAAPAIGVPLGNVTGEIDRIISEIELPDGFSTRWSGSTEMMEESIFEMGKAAILAILLLYMLLAAILESFRQPFLILSTVPLALIGVFFIQYISGLTMNIISMMAIIMLTGIVVTNAILILDFANQLIREKGLTVREALLEACPIKLKPIVMTNLAIILGMLPMAMGIGSAGREFRQSMGIVSIGGLIMATILSLYVIPALYFVTTKNRKKISE